MHASEHLFEHLTYNELYYTLSSVTEEDNYLIDYIVDELSGEFMYLLELYDLIWITSDDRILLTQKGEKILQNLVVPVELTKISTKVKYTKKRNI